jgi:hypothetical protein
MDDFRKVADANITQVQETYLQALRAILRLDQINAGSHLNNAKEQVIRAAGKSHFTQLEDNDFAIIHPDLTLENFYALYGDCTPSSHERPPTTPWVRDRGMVEMIGKHIRAFGTEDDVTLFNTFLNNHHAIFQGAPVFRVA